MECSGIWHSSGASSSNGEICDRSSWGRGDIVGWGDEEGRRARKSEEEGGRMKGREDGGEEEETDSVQLATKC